MRDEAVLTPADVLEYLFDPGNQHTSSIAGSLAALSLEDLRNLSLGAEDLQNVSSRQFEELIAELLRADGYQEVRLIPRHNAPGPDVIAICAGPSGQQQQYLVECKRWRSAVGISVVRDVMYRVDTELRATGGVIVTSSRFTRQATEIAQSTHKWRLTLKDAHDIHEWVLRHAVSIRRGTLSQVPASRVAVQDGGRLMLEALRKNSRRLVVRKAAFPCLRCDGLEVCGLDLIEEDDFTSRCLYAMFHLCLSCLSVRYHEVELYEVWPACVICGIAHERPDVVTLL